VRLARTVIAVALLGAAIAMSTGIAGGHPSAGGHSRPAGAASAAPGQPLLSCPAEVRGLGWIAFTARARLELVDLHACRVRQVATGVAAGARFSPDGRWLAYSRSGAGSPAVVRVSGGAARSPLGAGIVSWWWAPAGELLYGVNHRGQLLAAAPGGPARVAAAGAIVTGAVGLSPNGRLLAISTSRCLPARSELDTVDVATGARRVAINRPHAEATFAGWSPDGRWLLYWAQAQCSASLSADGWPLDTVPAPGGRQPSRAVAHMLLYPDFLSWCGRTLIAATGPSRETQLDSRLVATGPPSWRPRTIAPASHLSWVSPDCSPSGTLLAAAAGPNTQDSEFGAQHRSIWLLAPGGRVVRRLTTPAPKLSDEAPRFSRSARWILFVRTQVRRASSLDTLELVPAARSGAASTVPLVRFTSGDISFYDHFSWAQEIDWSTR
jgi:dipeptidyl aminopeptidase/acylaminoacyl peptidase